MWNQGEVAPGDLKRTGTRVAYRAGYVQIGSALFACGVIALIAGCSRAEPTRPHAAPISRPQAQSTSPIHADGQSIRRGGGVYKIGAPYKIAGRWYIPREDPNYDRTGIASWYGADFHGRKTANGELYDMNALTAAHPTLPIPSYAYVTSLKTGRTVLVRINDRGPYAKDRITDLSRRTAEVLGIAAAGISEVRVRYAGRAPLNGDDGLERRFLAAQPWAARTLIASRAPVQPRGAEWRGRMGLMRGE